MRFFAMHSFPGSLVDALGTHRRSLRDSFGVDEWEGDGTINKGAYGKFAVRVRASGDRAMVMFTQPHRPDLSFAGQIVDVLLGSSMNPEDDSETTFAFMRVKRSEDETEDEAEAVFIEEAALPEPVRQKYSEFNQEALRKRRNGEFNSLL